MSNQEVPASVKPNPHKGCVAEQHTVLTAPTRDHLIKRGHHTAPVKLENQMTVAAGDLECRSNGTAPLTDHRVHLGVAV